ncbi:glycosyltransferase family 2 protein [Fodinicurvata halophila]|uniref:Glycosyltransferase family 2 protein n=1 Tax=Fodinicurvata halophila TaxID=1419723 RepID=A0ABV8UKK7_9PROT
MVAVSVVIPTCDRPDLLERALASVMGQSRAADEVIVVDNGRHPVRPERLPASVILLSLPPRVGASRARNAGAAQAGGDYVAFLDDDDAWMPDYLERIVDAMEGASRAPDMLIARMDEVVGGARYVKHSLDCLDRAVSEILTDNLGFSGQNTVVRKAAFDEVGGYDPDLVTAEDRALAVDFLLHGKHLVAVPQAVVLRYAGREDHLDCPENRILTHRTFYRKYRSVMGPRARLTYHARRFRRLARSNKARRRWLAKAQRRLGWLLMRLAACFPHSFPGQAR